MSTTEARLEILTRINRATQGAQASPLPPYPRPDTLPREDVLRTFEDRIVDYRAGFVRVEPDGVREAVRADLGDARRMVVPDGLDVLWDDPPLTHAQLDGADAVVTSCAVAVATTGTIILDHGAGQGRRALTLVPDVHVCVIHADQIVPDVLDGVQAVAPAVRAGRPLTWLSGGSATSGACRGRPRTEAAARDRGGQVHTVGRPFQRFCSLTDQDRVEHQQGR